jgi:glucose/arabinose dehydrogenase
MVFHIFKQTLLAIFLLTALPAAASPEAEPFQLNQIISGLDQPWAVTLLPGDSRLITLRGGSLLYHDGKTVQAVEGIPPITPVGQGGLLDMILHPGFEENRLVYFTFSQGPAGRQGTSVARGVFRDGQNPGIENWQIIFSGNNRTGGGLHFGSRMAFGSDGLLYVTLGERGERDRAQDLFDHGGKVIRIREDGSIPPDNPFAANRQGDPAIFSSGHRNAQGLALEPGSDRIWLHEHGPRGGDEVNLVKGGANYGWPVITYGREYSGRTVGEGLTAREGMEQPQIYWDPSIAPSGMAFYEGDRFLHWQGDLFVGALAGQQLRRLKMENGRIMGQEILLANEIGRIRDVRTGPDGYLYILTDGEEASLYRLEPPAE